VAACAHFAWVCTVDAVDVGPDGDVAALEQRPQQGRRVVTAVPFQRADLALGIGADAKSAMTHSIQWWM